jgi:hypothetical protein
MPSFIRVIRFMTLEGPTKFAVVLIKLEKLGIL